MVLRSTIKLHWIRHVYFPNPLFASAISSSNQPLNSLSRLVLSNANLFPSGVFIKPSNLSSFSMKWAIVFCRGLPVLKAAPPYVKVRPIPILPIASRRSASWIIPSSGTSWTSFRIYSRVSSDSISAEYEMLLTMI
ncbi:hypothetical protein H112_03152 [Trichophyton rubrum D6]|uniref:Uncharacterized protein n=2 Tax=Trichophyton rubrum TaxID=5551 RepID=A0A080WMI8_TRIRC|nr:uncharacterized protein TERG_12336 [Trichophyton rubrum CBS 118892]EZF24282.1 hypothetical protein H100_03156 [Trichophyton rubrum MR850]EZF43367.1 hypothetical protein H102_03150 [Trichophyton rubrum CBS 100081]EZF54088.1 hypothetical protein H103_03164 [Trichophyton rubrum CBS 288.86]EZF64615.1 hypothetical protein H104_03146 [Trichophyton rubrum CBS 289.86]EZF85993.1 hypothetical protein H110_03157 [Trichophyton rubrum MR1448]EZF96722.1 hypothetical protein H113_03165 [Trichophyton rubr